MTSNNEAPLTRRQLIAVIAALVAAIATAIVFVVVVPPAARRASPDIPVTAYLRALVRGDVPQALTLGRITPAAGDRLLTTDAYAAASDRITSFRITGTRTSGGTATVTARITQGAAQYTTRFTAEREPGLPGITPWMLAPQQLPQIAVTVAGPQNTSIVVSGVTLAGMNDATTQDVLPGTYAISAAPSAVSTAAAQRVTVRLGQAGGSTHLDVALTSAGRAQVQSSARAWLAQCAASGDLAPSGCPFRAVATPGITYSAGQWSIASDPTLTVGAWDAQSNGWQIGTSAPGSVTFTAHAVDGDEVGTASTGARPFVVSGTAVPNGSGVAFVPSPSYSSSTGAATA